MVNYNLSLKTAPALLPPAGQVTLDKAGGRYLLRASYTDRGGLPGHDRVLLRPARLPAQEATQTAGIAKRNLTEADAVMAYNEAGAWMAFHNLDLTGIRAVSVRFGSPGLTGKLELRLNAPNGPLIGTLPVEAGAPREQTPRVPTTPTNGVYTLYVVYREKTGGIGIWKRLEVSWLEFHP